MRISGILIAILLSFFLLRLGGLIEFSAAKIEYDQIHSTLYNKGDLNNSLIIKESNTYDRWSEDVLARFQSSTHQLLEEYFQSIDDLLLDVKFNDQQHFFSQGDNVEICLDKIVATIDIVESKLFSTSYKVKFDAEVNVYHPSSLPVDNHGYTLDTKAEIVGLHSDLFVEYQLKKLFIEELRKIAMTQYLSN